MDALRIGGLLPAAQSALNQQLKKETNHSRTILGSLKLALHPVVDEFRTMITHDDGLLIAFNHMLESSTTVKGYDGLFTLINQFTTEAPVYGQLNHPFYTFLQEARSTGERFASTVTIKLNTQLRKIFKARSNFLSSFDSVAALSNKPGGWFSPEALVSMEADFDGRPFHEVFDCDPNSPHWGFDSWDHFFIRQLKASIRTLDLPDQPSVINAACESIFDALHIGVTEDDQFSIKGERYSLRDLLNNDETFPEFIGGAFFQGVLEATGYHRWHAPIDGMIKKLVTVPGTYFAPYSDDGPSPFSSRNSLAARQLIFIESSNPSIGLMCLIAIGMTEASSCEATVEEGQRVKRGDELGMFHFGGSTHCLAFRPEAKIKWEGSVVAPGALVKVRSALGAVAPSTV